jgi:CHAT domain-containing protein/Tfp pilus assembly protein PilF
VLVPGEVVEGRLDPGGKAAHRLEVGAETYVRVRAAPLPAAGADGAESERRTGEVTVRVSGDGDRPLLEAVGVRGETGGLLAWVADAAGRYRVEVENTAPLGATAYRLVVEARPARTGDRHRAAAETARAEADRLAAGDAGREAVLAALERALEQWRLAGETDAAAGVLVEMADFDWPADPETALARCEEVIDLSAAPELAPHRIDAWNLRGRILRRRQGGCPGALAAYEEARAIAVDTGDLERAAMVLYNVAVLQLTCAPDRAPAAFDEAIAAARSADDLVSEAYSYLQLAQLAKHRGDLDAALDDLGRAWSLAERAGSDAGEVRAAVSHEQGNLYRRLGRLPEALESYERSADLNESLGRADHLTDALLSLGTLALDLRRPEDAEEYNARALRAAESARDQFRQSVALRELGAVYHRREDYRRAEEYFRRALRAAEQLDAGPKRTRALAAARFRLGAALLAQGRPGDAVVEFRAALESQRDAGNRVEEALTLRELGVALGRLGETALALEHLSAALDLDREHGEPLRVLWTLHRLAEVQARLDPRRALQTIEEAIQIGQRVRSGLSNDLLRAGFAEGPRLLYDLYVDLLVVTGDEPAAFTASEEGRARALLDLLSEARVELGADVAPELRGEQRALDGRIAWLQNELSEAAIAGRDERRQAALKADLERAEQEWWRLDAAIRARSPGYQELRAPRVVTADEVRRDLPPGRALLEYWLGDEHAYAFVLTPDTFALVALPPTREIQAQVTALRSALLALAPPLEFGRPAHRLYRELVAPALAAARAAGEPIRELVVVPDGALHLIPFEALITTAPRAGERFEDLGYLVRDLAISYAPSATVLASLESGVTRPGGETETRSEPPLQFLAFADPRYDRPLALNCPELDRGSAGGSPLDSAVRSEPLGRLAGSRAEVQSIERLYGRRGRVYLGSEASEERIKSDPAVAAAERVHLAVHGVVCESFPERSGLVFALDGGREDGILQTREIFGLRLAADLVVLSACETGVGRLVSGEGVVGLTRAFFYAGAPSLVVSLWQVSDRSTARLMTSFYEHLDRGEDKAVALQRSRLALIEAGGPGAVPFYWAPFVVQGSRGVSAGR